MRTARDHVGWTLILAMGLGAGLPGCGSNDEAAPEATNLSTKAPNELPTTAVPNADDAPLPVPEKDTPEWYVREITLLRLQPTPDTEDLNQLRAFQRERNYQIVQLAKHAIAKTHEDPAKERLFDVAVHHAMEAQLQLAIQMQDVPEDEHAQNVEELYQNAELLFRRDAKSKAANEAGFALVNFAEIMARKLAQDDPRWLEEYARQARLFAKNFPQDGGRALAKLDAAAWSCEAHGDVEQAIACYAQMQEQFPENPRSQHVPAVLRRLRLKGQELQLAGPTHDGKYLSISDLRDKVVLITFWSSATEQFPEHLALLKQAYGKFAAAGLEIVGVNLDEDEAQFQAVLKQHNLTWPNVFYVDQDKRRWNNPLVKYYGIREIPAYWLVDRQGVVVETHVDLTKIEPQIEKLLMK